MPKESGGPEHGDIHEKIHADPEEERQARGKRIHIQPGGDCRTHVLNAVGERIAKLQVRCRAGLLHVVAGDRNRVEARHLFRRVADNVRDDTHRRFGRIDIGVPNHELLQDIVLGRAPQGGGRHARPPPRAAL